MSIQLYTPSEIDGKLIICPGCNGSGLIQVLGQPGQTVIQSAPALKALDCLMCKAKGLLRIRTEGV